MLPDSQDKNMQKWPDRENLIACCNLIPFKYESETSHKYAIGNNINAETRKLDEIAIGPHVVFLGTYTFKNSCNKES